MLESLSVFAAAIVPKAVVTKDPKGFAQRPIGSGAFSLKQFSKGQFTHLVRNPYYWQKGKPYLDEVMMTYVPDDNTRILKLQAGEADAATLIPYSQISSLNKGKTRVQIEPLFRWDGIWLNEAQEADRRQEGPPGAQLRHRQGRHSSSASSSARHRSRTT